MPPRFAGAQKPAYRPAVASGSILITHPMKYTALALALSFIVGLIFGIEQVRAAKRDRRERLTLEALRRQLACSSSSLKPLFEYRYPYIDRDLLEFSRAIPREQLVRPGQRRSLMRRALVGIVPDEILNRKRKAFGGHSVMMAIGKEWSSVLQLTQEMVSDSLGIIDSSEFCKSLRKGQQGQEIHIVTVMRTLGIEYWLRSLRNRK